MDGNQGGFYDLHDVSDALGLDNQKLKELVKDLEVLFHKDEVYTFYDGFHEVLEKLPEELLETKIDDLEGDDYACFERNLDDIVESANKIFHFLHREPSEEDLDKIADESARWENLAKIYSSDS